MLPTAAAYLEYFPGRKKSPVVSDNYRFITTVIVESTVR